MLQHEPRQILKQVCHVCSLCFLSFTSCSTRHSPQCWETAPGRLCTGRRYVLAVGHQWGESFRRLSLLPPTWPAIFMSFSIHVHCFCNRQLQERTHTQSDTCWAPSVTSSSLQPLINPAFPCGRSLRSRCWGKKIIKGKLPLSTHNETISLVWQDPVLASSSRGCGEIKCTVVWTQCWPVDDGLHSLFRYEWRLVKQETCLSWKCFYFPPSQCWWCSPPALIWALVASTVLIL